MKRRFQAVKGTRDILPPESSLWNRVEATARQVLEAYGYQEIRPPVFEDTELFARSVGAETDIVSKEMYTFADRPAGLSEEYSALLSAAFSAFPRSHAKVRALFQELDGFVRKWSNLVESGQLPRNLHNVDIVNALIERRNALARLVEKPRSAVESGKIVSEICELLYRILEKGGLEGPTLALRPEATAQVCRAYIEHGLHTRPGLVKLYYIGPMFRRERPQKGRFRQFYQIGAEVLGGSDHPAIDAEVIELVMVFLERCGLPAPSGAEGKGATLFINSIGCGDCRPMYVERLRNELQKVKDRLGPDSQRRIDTNPLRVLDSKLEAEQPIIARLLSILDHLCDACRDHYAKVKQELKDRGIAFEENWRLVRGLDYYMRTTFEITAPGLGAQNAVCGGGRYDGLVELLGGPPTKGIGWALGTDRLVLALEQTEAGKAAPHLDAFIVWLGEAAYKRGRQLARTLRDAGVRAEIPYEEMKMKKALGRADQLGACYAVILGEDELKAGTFTLRDLSSSSQRSLSEAELLRELSSRSG